MNTIEPYKEAPPETLEEFVQRCRIAYRSIHNVPRHYAAVSALADQCDALRAEVERLAECEADARRYRWLRTERYMFREGAVVTCDSQPEKVALWVKCPVTNDAREVDAAIDAAMAGENEGET